jgi:hypothetical protein
MPPPSNARPVCVNGNACAWGNDSFPRCGLLLPGEKLGVLLGWTTLFSCSGAYRLDMQGDSNLVIYESTTMRPIWSSSTWVANFGQDSYAFMQGDGNFMVVRHGQAVWASNTWGHPGSFLMQRDDGNLVVYEPDPSGRLFWRPLWQSLK